MRIERLINFLPQHPCIRLCVVYTGEKSVGKKLRVLYKVSPVKPFVLTGLLPYHAG